MSKERKLVEVDLDAMEEVTGGAECCGAPGCTCGPQAQAQVDPRRQFARANGPRVRRALPGYQGQFGPLVS